VVRGYARCFGTTAQLSKVAEAGRRKPARAKCLVTSRLWWFAATGRYTVIREADWRTPVYVVDYGLSPGDMLDSIIAWAA
jgi:hypothetical protein